MQTHPENTAVYVEKLGQALFQASQALMGLASCMQLPNNVLWSNKDSSAQTVQEVTKN